MIKNAPGLGMVLLAAAVSIPASSCRIRRAEPAGYQGVVEYQERDLAFEMTGRITDLWSMKATGCRPTG